MKNRKLKSTKAGSSRNKVPSDVTPSTSLPPLVEGQLRCFLRVTVSRVLWTIPKRPAATLVRLRWWGESTDGTHFRPRDGSHTGSKTVTSTARFPIRCGPKQFTSYLTDMGSLMLEVLTKPDHLPIARAQVSGISRLSLSHSISGFYTLVSPTSDKLGELQVALALEALTETYDSSSSVPTTDMSMETAVSVMGSATKPPQTTTLVVPSLSRPLSVNSGKDSVGGSSANTPRGRDHLYFQSAQGDKRNEMSLENQMPMSARTQHGQGAWNPTVQETHHGRTSNDILSVLLERGSKLRNAMVVSALKTDADSEVALKDILLPLHKDNIIPPRTSPAPPCGRLLQNILHADSSLLQSAHIPVSPGDLNPDYTTKAVDLLLGSLNGSALPLWDGDGSPPESLSGHSSVCGDSELNDPQYDQSLLETLFYKAPWSDSGPSDSAVEDEGGPSPRRSPKKGSLRGAEEQLRHSGPNTHGGLRSEQEQTPGANHRLAGLTMDQLTALGGIRLARVVVHSLAVPTDGTVTTPRKASDRGKPPRPLANKKCSYFVEYLFPVASRRHDHSQPMAAEVIRVVSSKVSGGAVKFQQRSVFPVQFSGPTIEQWWGTDLTFKIYSRKSSQKKPVHIGTAVSPLRCLLQREQLSQTIILPVQKVDGTGQSQEVGPLKVSLELAADSKDFSSAKSRLRATLSPQRGPSPSKTDTGAARPQSVDPGRREDCSSGPRGDSEVDMRTVRIASSGGPSPLPSLQTSPVRPAPQQLEDACEVLLHALLMVPDGKDFNCGPLQPPNIYLNCKLFGSDETSRSVISWGQTNPSFNFVQVAPVALTSRLLERMRNNVMVIEVWQRAGSSGQDRPLGLVKLPLHQFYMSFRDPKISHLLLQAQYPVLGVDSFMPVIDVFSGSCKGNLRVLLAMGISGQIVALQRMREEEHDSITQLPRPVHLLDHRPHTEAEVREHLFMVRVEKVKGLTPLQSAVWGEADCYVQYSFPSQEQGNPDPDVLESSISLKPFRTTTTLCVPDPVFGHSETHVLLAPLGVPVQRLLLSSFSSQRLANGGGVQFEVWCRYYYPNVRDQLVARGMLPLSRLCAMVTMQRRQPSEAQVFSLPLLPRTNSPEGHQPQPSGLLDVCVHYKHRPLRPDGPKGGAVAARLVTVVVQVHRAAGLQAAARAVSEQDGTFQYYADVGVNACVTAELSFLPDGERRSTRVAARTFCPEFDHHTDFPCEMLVQRSTGETSSLAEILQEATAVFTVWNRESRRVMDSSRSKDRLLGTVTIPLADLIRKRTGICGWFAISVPQDQGPSHGHHILVGGLEISINFAHRADRERVIASARALGWEVGRRGEEEDLEEEEDSEGEVWGEGRRTVSLTLSMPRAWLPLSSLLLPGHNDLQRSTYCYLRYKLYDSEAFCSPLRHPSVEEEEGGGKEGLATVAFKGSRSVELRSSLPLLWYLREERLEVQVWVAFGKHKTPRPHDTDRLVGSAFVDLSALARRATHKLTVSGVHPLFRRSAPDLSGAALRVHVTLTPGSVPEEPIPGGHRQDDCDSQGALSPGEELEEERRPPSAVPSGLSPSRSGRQTKISTGGQAEANAEETFAVTVTVDRAMHLSLKGCPLAERNGGMPCCCVSYATADSGQPVATELIADSDCPVWGHQQECRLSKQLLVDPQQSLVFKVWHKGDLERVIGFASVDLSPLLSGFQSVCGWYNITDFSGQCQGQLKVSISPLKGVQELRGQRQAVNDDGAKDSSALFQTLPLYHTTATYSSFPSHISRFLEQRIKSPEKLLSERSSESDRHDEHMDNVRLYHQSLQEGGAARPTSGAGDAHPSSSVLFSALRKNLSELDDIQRYFSHKLSTTTTFTSLSEQGHRSRLEEHRDSETDTGQLLLKSSRLVGEVNGLISGLESQRMEPISSSAQSCSSSLPVPDQPVQSFNPEALPPRSRKTTDSTLEEVVLCSRKTTDSTLEEVVPCSRKTTDSTLEEVVPCSLKTTDSTLVEVVPCSRKTTDSTLEEVVPCSRKTTDSTLEEVVPCSLKTTDSTLVEVVPCSLKTTDSTLDEVSPLPSPLPRRSEEHSEEDEEDYADHQKAPGSEDESDGDGGENGRQEMEEEEEDDDDEDYEETIVQPRPLNEVTSLTDRTSPWTSLLSDPDLGSLESLEAPEEQPAEDQPSYHADLTSEGEEEWRVGPQPDNPQPWSSALPRGARVEESEHFSSDHSDGCETDAELDGERTPQAHGQESQEPQEPSNTPPLSESLLCSEYTASGGLCDRGSRSEDESPRSSHNPEDITSASDAHDSQTSPQKEKSQHSDPVEIPNFFLPTHHLEASMRALRLAPAFSLASCEPKKGPIPHGVPHRRAPRPRPNVPTSSMNKEETKRIAKIFSAHFNEER